MKLSEDDTANKICLVSDNHAIICCNNSSLYSIKFSHYTESPTMKKAKIPELPQDSVVYDIICTLKHDYLICTSVGLVRRNLKVDRKGCEFFMTNVDT